jgi:adenosine/AMP kinase
MELKAIKLEIPADANIILGQSHFIKTVEDLYEAIVNTVPQMKFGIAFNEASGACLTRIDGNDEALIASATANAQSLAAGHNFVIVMREGYPSMCSAASARSR